MTKMMLLCRPECSTSTGSGLHENVDILRFAQNDYKAVSFENLNIRNSNLFRISYPLFTMQYCRISPSVHSTRFSHPAASSRRKKKTAELYAPRRSLRTNGRLLPAWIRTFITPAARCSPCPCPGWRCRCRSRPSAWPPWHQYPIR